MARKRSSKAGQTGPKSNTPYVGPSKGSVRGGGTGNTRRLIKGGTVGTKVGARSGKVKGGGTAGVRGIIKGGTVGSRVGAKGR